MIHAIEALRHVGGAVDSGLRVDLLPVDDGVDVAKRDQQAEDSDWINLGSRLEDLIGSAPEGGLTVAGERGSLNDRGMRAGDRLDGVAVIDELELAERMAAAPVMAHQDVEKVTTR